MGGLRLRLGLGGLGWSWGWGVLPQRLMALGQERQGRWRWEVGGEGCWCRCRSALVIRRPSIFSCVRCYKAVFLGCSCFSPLQETHAQLAHHSKHRRNTCSLHTAHTQTEILRSGLFKQHTYLTFHQQQFELKARSSMYTCMYCGLLPAAQSTVLVSPVPCTKSP